MVSVDGRARLAALRRHDDRGHARVRRGGRPRRRPTEWNVRPDGLPSHRLRDRARRVGGVATSSPRPRSPVVGCGSRGSAPGRLQGDLAFVDVLERMGAERRATSTTSPTVEGTGRAARRRRSTWATCPTRRRRWPSSPSSPTARPRSPASGSSGARRPTASPRWSPSCAAAASRPPRSRRRLPHRARAPSAGGDPDLRRPPHGHELRPARAASRPASRSPIPAAWPRPSPATGTLLDRRCAVDRRRATRVPVPMRVIAIDGPAGSGKSTVARALAEPPRPALPRHRGDVPRRWPSPRCAAASTPRTPSRWRKVARDLDLRMDDGRHDHGRRRRRHHRDPRSRGHPGGEHRGRQPRGARARCAGASGSGPTKHGGGVLEGRDIGTVVFPDAELKVYLDASPRCGPPAGRKEVAELAYETVAADLARRDALDQGRADCPLREADDAVVIDTSDLTVDDIVDAVHRSSCRERGLTRGRSELVIIPAGHEFGEQLSAASAARLPRSCGAWSIGVTKTLLPGRGRRRRDTCRSTGVHPVAHPPLEPRHALRRADHASAACATWARSRSGRARSAAWFLTALGGFPVKRGTADREALRACHDVLERGEPLVMFPEGTRQFGPDDRSEHVRRRRRSWPVAPACRSCRSASAAPRRPCPRARSSSTR